MVGAHTEVYKAELEAHTEAHTPEQVYKAELEAHTPEQVVHTEALQTELVPPKTSQVEGN